MGYGNNIGWDCRIRAQILEKSQNLYHTGDAFDTTDRRLQKARNVCELQWEEKSPAGNAPMAHQGAPYVI